MAEKPGSSAKRTSQVAQAYQFANEILSAAISLALLAWGGSWLDGKFGSKPLLTITGACLGFLVAGFSLRRLLKRLDRQAAAKRSAAEEERSSSR